MVNQVNAEQTPKPVVTAKMPRPRPRHDVVKRLFLLLAALSGFLWVTLGALAGHGLFNAGQHADFFDKAHRYQIVHTLALLALVSLPPSWPLLLCRTAGFLWILGLFAFCGSLYWMAFTATPDLRLVVPVGGIAFLLGWAMLFFAACWGERHGR